MNDRARLVGRIAELEARGNRLQNWGKRVGLTAVAVFGATALVYWPDPAGNRAFDTYVALPTAIEAYLRAQGVQLAEVGPALIANGMSNRWRLALAFPVIFVLHWLLRRLIPSRIARLALLWASPFWLGSLLSPLDGSARPKVQAARRGTVVDHRGAPSAASTGTGRAPAPAFVLQPHRLRRGLADQAHYVLAQQSYLDARPDRTAIHLRAITGAWQPQDVGDQTRIGVMVEYARRNGTDPGTAASRLSHGHPYALALRHVMVVAVVALAVALGLAGFVLCAFGTRRRARASALSLKANSVPAPIPDRPRGFGNRAKVAG